MPSTFPRSRRAFNKRKLDLLAAEKGFRKSCEQIVLLNQKLTALQKRYDAAKRHNARAFRYNLRLRLAIVEGMRNVYYDFAHEKAKQVADIRQELFGEIVEIITEGEDDMSGDTDSDS
ncbi:hypothetical protein FSP39_017351 [Pinctada imbricata]|uniref:Uncharacterized protein n=1 Tax=Pinctada imbricata TaxID=66713 RepID=A0AA89C7N2_PINIB|nr:hypothetical protein FSP39_017351 [Pinctada imbricata]